MNIRSDINMMSNKELINARLAFLQDTITYYTTDVNRRAVEKDDYGFVNCSYKTTDGRKCAIGRHLLDNNISLEGKSVTSEIVQSLLPEEIKLLGIDFLWAIQRLHDENAFWNEFGLSKEGQLELNDIKFKFCDYFLSLSTN